MKNIFFFILIYFFTLSYVYSYDCKTNLQYSEYERSDYIFTGRIIEVNYLKRYYRVKVTENIKGSANEVTTLSMGSRYDSSIHPERFDFWLIYASKNKSDSLFADCCGHSIQLTGYHKHQIPPPPMGIIVNQRYLLKSINQAYTKVEDTEEILSLRLQVQNDKIEEIFNSQQNIIANLENELLYLKGFATISLVLLILLFFKKNPKP